MDDVWKGFELVALDKIIQFVNVESQDCSLAMNRGHECEDLNKDVRQVAAMAYDEVSTSGSIGDISQMLRSKLSSPGHEGCILRDI